MARHEHNPGYTESVRRLMDLFARLPGVGSRSAERMAFHVLKSSREDALALADAIHAVKDQVRHCSICYNLTEADPCSICADPARDHGVICVVEQPKDLLQLESTGIYSGVYHVLLGRIAPLENIGPSELTIPQLIDRIRAGREAPAAMPQPAPIVEPTGPLDDDPFSYQVPVTDAPPPPPARPAPGAVPIREVILATNPTMEGDGTALYLQQELGKYGVQITRLARGLPAGAQIEYSNKAILADAISGRTRV